MPSTRPRIVAPARRGLVVEANQDGSLQVSAAIRVAGADREHASAVVQDLAQINLIAAGRAVLERLDASGHSVLIGPLGEVPGPPNLLVLALPPRDAWRTARTGWMVLYEPRHWPNGLSATPGDVLLLHGLAQAAAMEAPAAENAYRASRGLPARKADPDHWP